MIYKFKTENQRVNEVIRNHHPIERENFDIEGYHNYCWRPEDKTKFVSTRSMHHDLNDLKRTVAESTLDPNNSKSRKSTFDVSRMVEESKTTIRSQEPYIGGESETGERIYRQRDKKKEDLSYRSINRSLCRTVKREPMVQKLESLERGKEMILLLMTLLAYNLKDK